jgi:hypothetical protein
MVTYNAQRISPAGLYAAAGAAKTLPASTTHNQVATLNMNRGATISLPLISSPS